MSQALATANQTDQRVNYCKLLVWWKSPDKIEDHELLRKIMNLGTWEMRQWTIKKSRVKFFIYGLTEVKCEDFASSSGTTDT